MNEQALKARMRSIALEQNQSFQEVWRKLTLERFLSRLSRSKHQDQFIFKGGRLLAYYLDLNRETKDLDFLLLKLNCERKTLEQALNDIISIRLDDDFSFSLKELSKLNHDHINYPGFRVKLNLFFHQMKDIIHLDLGVGDSVEPTLYDLNCSHYKNQPLFEHQISLKVYPPEAIIVEKLETLIYHGTINSRMKDYHDLYFLFKVKKYKSIILEKQIRITFKNRNTALKIPIKNTVEEFEILQQQWERYLNGLVKDHVLPKRLNEVITVINNTLMDLDLKKNL